ncbi:hypothetical protein [Dethiothermospora halolimnae]|uniref:hypothetical protein n=1 Tax=Dethiothermospora halolimnae TaxID=3114390 RepID=UPI003CCB9212
MIEIFIKHNPYKIETEFKIDGEEIDYDSRLLMFRKEKIDTWIDELIIILENELNEDSFKITFNGMNIHCKEMKRICKYYNDKGLDIKLEYTSKMNIENKLRDIKSLNYFIQQESFFGQLERQYIQNSLNKVISSLDIDEKTFISSIRGMVQYILQIIQRYIRYIDELSENISEDIKEKLEYTHIQVKRMLAKGQQSEGEIIRKNNLYNIKNFENNTNFIKQETIQELQQKFANEGEEMRDEILKMKKIFNKRYSNLKLCNSSEAEEYIYEEILQDILKLLKQSIENMALEGEKTLENAFENMLENLKKFANHTIIKEKKDFLENLKQEKIQGEKHIEEIINENRKKSELIRQKIDVLLTNEEKFKYNKNDINKQYEIFNTDKIFHKINKLKNEFNQITNETNKKLRQDFHYNRENWYAVIKNEKAKLEEITQNITKKWKQRVNLLIQEFRDIIHSTSSYIGLYIEMYSVIDILMLKLKTKVLSCIEAMEEYIEGFTDGIINEFTSIIECYAINFEKVLEDKAYIDEVAENLEELNSLTEKVIDVLEA